MLQIEGKNNRLIFIFPNRTVDCLAAGNEEMKELLREADLSIIGDDNSITMRFDTEENAGELLRSGGFLLIVKGNGNVVNLGSLIIRCSPILGMTGLKLIVGQLPGLGTGVSRTADNCQVEIGDRVVINGATVYLQENRSQVRIGDDSQLSWGVDVWCTDAHTITDLEGNVLNFAESIEIGRHVWIGRDVKVGKNVRIADNSIVGWGSIVTRRFDEPNVIIAGNLAKVIKRGINWDRKSIDKYLKSRTPQGE